MPALRHVDALLRRGLAVAHLRVVRSLVVGRLRRSLLLGLRAAEAAEVLSRVAAVPTLTLLLLLLALASFPGGGTRRQVQLAPELVGRRVRAHRLQRPAVRVNSAIRLGVGPGVRDRREGARHSIARLLRCDLRLRVVVLHLRCARLHIAWIRSLTTKALRQRRRWGTHSRRDVAVVRCLTRVEARIRRLGVVLRRRRLRTVPRRKRRPRIGRR